MPDSHEFDITVVTISFNQAKYLRECIDSVINQPGARIQYIIIDAGSTDGSREIINQYRDQVDTIIFEPDNGPADALNKGLRLAKGKYFYYLNSDDVVCENAFSIALESFAKRPRADVIAGNGLVIDGNGSTLRTIYSSQIFSPLLYAMGIATIVQQSAFIRTRKLLESGGFNRMNRTSWDGESFFDIAMNKGRYCRIWKVLGKFRIYGETISGSGAFDERIRKDHLRISGPILKSNPLARLKMFKILLWISIRVLDVRRWASYFRGRFTPTSVTGLGSSSARA